MKYVLVKGIHFGNKGAELMFLAIKQHLNETRDDIRIVLAPGGQSSFERRMDHKAYQLVSIAKGKHDLNGLTVFIPERVRSFARERFGLIFESDLSAILDASGFAYGDNWPLENSQRSFRQATRQRRKGGKYIFMPQAFGPFSRGAEVKYITAALKISYAAYARDQVSHNYIAKMGLDLPIIDDFTSVVKSKPIGPREGLVIVPNSNMLRGKMGWNSEKYLDVVVRIAQRFYEETKESVVVLNHEGSSDGPISEKLKCRISETIGTCSLLEPRNAREAKQALAAAKLVFSSRYHGCISALTSGVICIGTSWSHKYQELYKGYDAEMLLLSADDVSAAESLVDHCLSNRSIIEADLTEKAAENTLKSKLFLQDCLSVI